MSIRGYVGRVVGYFSRNEEPGGIPESRVPDKDLLPVSIEFARAMTSILDRARNYESRERRKSFE